MRLGYLPSQPDTVSTQEGRLPSGPPSARSAPPWDQHTWSATPSGPAHTARSSAPSHTAAAGRMGTASLSAQAVGDTTASIRPVGNRHCPQGQQPTTPPWLDHPLATQLPGPHCLRTCTVPETRRPCIRSPQRRAYQALVQASSRALTRLATDERFLGTALPGCPGVLPTWGRQLQDHPHLHDIVPGGGLSRTARPGCPPGPTSLSRSQRSPPSPAPSSKPRCATPVCWSRGLPRSGPSPGMSRVRPLTTATRPSPPSPPLSSRCPLHPRLVSLTDPPGPLHLPERGQCPSPPRPPRRPGVSPPVPPPVFPEGFRTSALRLVPGQRCRLARHPPPADRAGPPGAALPPPRRHHRAGPVVRPVVPHCVSSCASGPPTSAFVDTGCGGTMVRGNAQCNTV